MIGHSPRHCFLGKNFQEDCGKHIFIYVICVVQLYPRNYTTLWARSVKGKNLGLVMTDGDFQTRQKNFCMKQLKNFGFGKKDFESVILEQARELVKYLERKEGKMTINNSVFSTSAVNLIWSLVAGYSFDREDPEIKGRTQSYDFH